MTVEGTLCFVRDGERVLLQKKSQGLFGAEKWNAPGGKIKPGEDPEECAIREVAEETGLRVENLENIGVLNFFKNGQRGSPDWVVFVFLTESFAGTLKQSREGVLKWFDAGSLPFGEMWEDDRYWYKYALERRKFRGSFYFAGDFEKLLDHEISPTSL